MGRRRKFTIPDDPRRRERALVVESSRGRLANVKALLDLGVDPDSRADFAWFLEQRMRRR